MSETVIRAAVLGAGPSGFYTAEQLLGRGYEVDLYDRLPTPFGLVRAGVAPDHPKIKSVTRVYEKTAKNPAFRFFGGVELGSDVSREELLERYHIVVYAVGTPHDHRLGIPGEDLRGSHSATDFVGWYNGHPDYPELEFDLSSPRVVVIGNGNVALDVARMLVLDESELGITDTADHALEVLRAAGVREVLVVGRRGPAQAAFTNPELRELGELSRADVVVDPDEVELDQLSAEWLDSDAADTTARRNVEVLREYAERDPGGKSHRIVLRFLRSPVEILGDERGAVSGIRLSRNRIEAGEDGRMLAVATGEQEILECGMVLRAVGYRGRAIPGVPFDERRGLIPTDECRVLGDDGAVLPGEYAVGWIKRGPSGVIGTNKKCATETMQSIIADAEAGALGAPSAPDGEATEAWLRERVPALVTWEGWGLIDAHEQSQGAPHGRPRVKIVSRAELHALASAELSAELG